MRNHKSIRLLTLMLLAWNLIFHVEGATYLNSIDAKVDVLTSPYGQIFKPPTGFPDATSSRGAGDINGDGHQDLLISWGNNNYIYIIFGTPAGIPQVDLSTLMPTQGIKIYGGTTSTQLGSSIDAVGDVNGDTVDDIIVGEHKSNNVYVIFGKNDGSLADFNTQSFSPSQGILITTSTGTSTTSFGISVSRAGDVNDDGMNDMLIGVSGAVRNGAYVIFGKDGLSGPIIVDSLTTQQGFKISSNADSIGLGSSVSAAGDVNGDGVDDFMIGADKSKDLTGTINNAGMVGIFYGRKAGTPVSDIAISSLVKEQGCLVYGFFVSRAIGQANSLSSAGDINGDGLDDMILGHVRYYDTAAFGAAYVLYGKNESVCDSPIKINETTSEQGFKIKGQASTANLGCSVSAGDINNDGLSDIVVGSYQAASSYGTLAGKVYVLFGNKGGFSNIDFSSPANDTRPLTLFYYGYTSQYLGEFVDATKDLNEDGVNDIVGFGGNLVHEIPILFGKACNSDDKCSSSLHTVCYVSRGCVCGETGKKFQLNTCVSSCSDGYYLDSDNVICQSCPEGCATCSDSTTCGTCKATFLKQGNLCVSSCSDGYWLDSGNSICQTCPSGCATCTDSSTCQSCNTTHLLQATSCVTSCSDGYWLDSPNSACQTCPDGCATCSDSTTCGSCNSTHLLQETSCVTSCSTGYKKQGNTCIVDNGNTTPGGGETGGGTTPGGGETTPGGGNGGETTPGGSNPGEGNNNTPPETLVAESDSNSKVGMIVGITIGGVVLIGVVVVGFIYKGVIIAKLTKASVTSAAKYTSPTANKPTIQVTDGEEFMRLDTAKGDGQSPRSPQSPDSPISSPHGQNVPLFSQTPQTLQVLKVEVDP